MLGIVALNRLPFSVASRRNYIIIYCYRMEGAREESRGEPPRYSQHCFRWKITSVPLIVHLEFSPAYIQTPLAVSVNFAIAPPAADS